MGQQTSAREALVALVGAPFAAAYPGVPLVHDNSPFDWNNPPPLFVRFEVQFYGGDQVGASFTPRSRLRGVVYATAYAREGAGTREPKALLDWFAQRLRFARAAPVNLQAERPAGSAEVRGYYTEQIGIPFYTDPA